MMQILVVLMMVCVMPAGNSVSESEEKLLLKLHNDARNNVQPPAFNMPQLTWSNELATIAQNYTNRCIWGHNNARSTQSTSFSYVGENLYASLSTGSVFLTNGVKYWVDERKDYTYSNNSCSGGPCGHYTQVVWADTTKVGCGVNRCRSMRNLDWGLTTTFLVCNYGPGGNYHGEKPYKRLDDLHQLD